MAIVEMSKLKLVGISYEKDAVLNALQRTGVVQVTADETQFETSTDASGSYEAVSHALEELINAVTLSDRVDKKAEPISKYCDVSYERFMEIDARAEELNAVAAAINAALDRRSAIATRRSRIEGEIKHLQPYLALDCCFSEVKDTAHTVAVLGTVTSESLPSLTQRVGELSFASMQVISSVDMQVGVLVVAHKECKSELDNVLLETGFSKCTYTDAATPKQLTESLIKEDAELNAENQEIIQKFRSYKSLIPDLKVYADYLAYTVEKQQVALGFAETGRTFCLNAYVPKDSEQRVREEVEQVTKAVYFDFSKPEETDEVPTLLRNNAVVKQFEFVSNMYSPPNYRERDPNLVMGIFFMIFFGFIMADIGYGVLLAVGGLLVGLKMRKDNGARPLVLLIGMGGLFTIIWGALFGSFFGYTLFPSVMPNPELESETLLVYCLAVGVVQILVGYIMKGIQSGRIGNFWDGLFDGYLWSVFCVGILLVIPEIGTSLFNADMGFVAPSWLMYVGFGIAGFALVLEVFGAGRHAKGFGKFTKGFGAVYGIINFLSDVLSYARLFGLMLSGAIVARIVTEMSIGMMTSVGGIIGGVVILLIGHAFNLAMNVLGAYIHDSRLQYIEYFSRFYEGDGMLFRPLGSKFNYITIQG